MNIEQIKTMTRFPVGEDTVVVEDRAKLTIKRIKKQKLGKRPIIKYQGIVEFSYTNGVVYKANFQEETLHGTLEKSVKYYESRNSQMERNNLRRIEA